MIFALAFVLGILRTLWLAPRIGELPATALEIPLILGASWLWTRRLLKPRIMRSALSPGQALTMGAVAFALLMVSEAVLTLAFGTTIGGWLSGMTAPAGALGLAGQVAFALMPWLVARGSA